MRRREIPPFSDVPQFPREAILTIEEVAQALRCSVDTVERADFKCVYLGNRTRRFIWGQVLDALAERAA